MMRSPEKYRTVGKAEWGPNGAYLIPPNGRRNLPLKVIASTGEEWASHGMPLPPWEHVSVSTPVRCPTWEEMHFVKGLFWEAEDCVLQFHPPQSEYINNHPYVLHLWRPVGVDFPRPPSIAVGTNDPAEYAAHQRWWARFMAANSR